MKSNIISAHVTPQPAERLYTVLRALPAGYVLTYKQAGQLAGINSPRQVGCLLHQNPDPVNIPCHRVVNARGELAEKFAFGGRAGQAALLEADGISTDGHRVNLKIHRWPVEIIQG